MKTIKKFERELKRTLNEERKNLKTYQKSGEVGFDEGNCTGWVEALKYVLGRLTNIKEELKNETLGVTPAIQKAFDSIAYYYLRRNFWKGTNGIFSMATAVRRVIFDKYDNVNDPDSGYYEAEGWEILVKFGQQDDTSNESYTAKVYVADKDIKKWDIKKEPCPEFQEDGVGNCCFDVD